MSELTYEQEVRLRKYAYVLEQKRSLNDRTFWALTFFQGVITFVLGGVFSFWISGDLNEGQMRFVQFGAVGLIVSSGIFSTIILLVGVLSWIKYKREQLSLEGVGGAEPISESMKFKDIFAWYETYIVLGVWALSAMACSVVAAMPHHPTP